MIRLGISVEGKTERLFVNRVLRPHLLPCGIDTTGIDIRGNVSLDKIRGELPTLLGSFDRVSTMYDFYRFKRRGTLDVLALEAAIHSLVDQSGQERLLPYVQQYEFEALLFAAPVQMVEWLEGSETDLSTMQQAVRQCGSPEKVNDSPETSPSHRLQKLFGHRYDKPLHGPEIIELAGLPAIRAQCPRFDAWITRLEALGGQA
jgi:hypothetical protein